MGRKKGEHPTGKEAGKPDTPVMSDAVAEALETAGFYRRAARRWLEVLDRCCDSEERAWLAARRSQCLENARKPEPPAECFGDVCQAASDTQKRMGIHARNRFRRYPSEGDTPKKSSC
ncbi:PerC family transcriptional regulator [Salmonella enterica]|uniref:PerC family transcriptional regulator n=1 Tax=Salmonella enterica TaxID=28901 RepID=A0A5Z4EG70_SALER|nr:PerC family transcriptional regulator [Salmonella enterica]EAA8761672.1 PerC family transcriptional regulator [Salmonella enterica subsp. enterica serovar Rubislaw]EDM6247654.1 PerC family transcriptional regulator [Salmonella enterica subsp. enterica serovar Muenchen]EDO3332267.1 PerC family transcriptional regulator [Salmonella enterica subsp. enterica serovar Infantis]EDT7230028.1 PerC family transcriptional regulator [Salmonella enterica subsp. enterica]EDU4886061.1 PerC family transcri